MPAPPEFRERFVNAIARLLPKLVDRLWDAAEKSQKALQSDVVGDFTTGEKERLKQSAVILAAQEAAVSIVKTARLAPRRPRLRQGDARKAVRELIGKSFEEGITRKQLLANAPRLLGADLSENTLKRTLMDLRKEGEIYTKNSSWYPGEALEQLYRQEEEDDRDADEATKADARRDDA